jgi:hypothetical protein
MGLPRHPAVAYLFLVRPQMRYLLLLLLTYAIGSTAAASKPTDDPAFRQLDNAIKSYIAAHPHHTHPLHKKDLLAFAAKQGIPLDLSQFEVLEWYPRRHYLQINWKSRGGHQEIITFYSDQPI